MLKTTTLVALGSILAIVIAVLLLTTNQAKASDLITFEPGTPSDIANGGSLVSNSGTVQIGVSATYVSGGSGLTGIANVWPNAASPAVAASAIDHLWLQFDPPIVYSFGTPQSQVVAVAGIDHGPLPYEGMEFIVWGSNDCATGIEEGAITAMFDDGVDGSAGVVGESDDFSSVWSFNNNYTCFVVTSGDHLAGTAPSTEGEIDGLATLLVRVGGLTVFSSGSGSSAGSIALLVGGVSAVVAIAAGGGWYTRRRWLGKRS